MEDDFIKLTRDCKAILIPSGDNIHLKKNAMVKITQSLGGDFTLYVNGNLVKLSGDDADAIGKEVIKAKSNDIQKFNENAIWDVL